MKYKTIAIEGNIGAGKTSLAQKIAAHTGAELLLEHFEDNPYLADFYKHPDQYTFQLEVYFLLQRHEAFKGLSGDRTYISDHSLAKSLFFAEVNLKGAELDMFRKLYNAMQRPGSIPDITLYLYRSVDALQKNIGKRGRSYESRIADSYLDSIDRSYRANLAAYNNRTLILEVTDTDLLNDPKTFNKVMELLNTDHPKGLSSLRL